MRAQTTVGGSRRLAPTLVAAAALVLLTALAFSPIVRNGFVFLDDDKYLAENEVVIRGVTFEGLRLALTSAYAANWHPLTWLSHMIDVELFGLDPLGHHLVGVALHAAAATLLFLLIRALTARPGPAFVVAALFAVHPLRVESVAWAAERKDVLSGLLFFATLLAWAWHLRKPGPGRYGLSVLLFALALMAKPMVVTLPLLLLLLDWWPLGRLPVAGTPNCGGARRLRSHGTLVLEKLPLLALSMASVYLTLRSQETGGAIASLESIPLAARTANALRSYLGYLGMSAFPLRLASDYPHVSPGLLDPGTVASAFVLAWASAGAYLLRHRQPWLITGWAWYLIALVPVIGLVQVGDQARADRYTYLPLVGIALALCWSLAAAEAARPSLVPILRGGAAAAIAACTLLTMRQVTYWRDSETLFTHALAVSPESWKSANNLAVVRSREGRQDEALHLYLEAVRMKPTAAIPRNNLAEMFELQGRIPEAIDALRAAVRLAPDPLARMRLALLLDGQGLEAEAIGQLHELIRESPQQAAAYNNLATLLVRRGEFEQARELLTAALEIDPFYADARYNLAALSEYLREGGDAGAVPGIRSTSVPGSPPGALAAP